MPVPDYYNRVNPDLLRAIPAEAAVEVGCGGGALGAEFRSAHPAACYIGIEYQAEAAAVAATRLSRVVTGDVEKLGAQELGIDPASVDCLVYGDVLEHLVDPWATLQRQVAWLRPGGTVVACIPNVQHWSMLVRMLTGRWNYEAEGLMDRTHLRFFSAETIGDMLRGAGLRVEEIRTRGQPPTPQWEQLQQLARPLLEALGVKPEDYAQRSRALQYVVRATRA